ncbi:urocanate reductase precursor [Oxobacter pfennigii]|uniref:Urocanate reductase n=1 Tax=Oxobacter pfennigii TaxID=36849 RepID=A0A0P8X473_9CLOT|nr:FAD-dependent oxidoreductase [Oxobacter pfennigii]KPU45599.1 urocanate reductase precursor [Oxobacter pfennigii]
MKKIRKILVLLLCTALLLSIVGCSSQPAGKYKAGTYTASAKGIGGDVKVSVEFSDNDILEVKVLEHKETPGISDQAIEKIPQKVVAGQTLAVDLIAGASVTSKALLDAIEDCAKQAGGDINALKTASPANNTAKTETKLTCDVVIVGGGGTGLVAAASAYENGANVILIEKQASVGGSTALSGGGIAATDTRFQREKGIKDTKEDWMNLWKERQNTSSPGSKYPDYNRVSQFMDEAVKTTEWLVDYVQHFYARIEGFGLDPVARLHFAENGGAGLIKNIENFIRGKGVKIITETRVTELITDENGDVTGVIAEGAEGKVTVDAKKVILASGGFARSEELMKRFVPELSDYVDLTAAAAGSMGDGIMMAEAVGAELYEDPWVIGLGMTSRVPELNAAKNPFDWDWSKILVNKEGKRFMNEEEHYAVVTNKITEALPVWMIVDSSNKDVAALLASVKTSSEFSSGQTIEELAKAMGVPPDNLKDTIDTYNNGAATGKDEFGKSKNFIIPVTTAPFYAIKYYPKTMGTFGGVKTNDNYQVLRKDGSVINNLYAGGECANRVMYNQVYMSGSAVQFALTSGRISGKHAALAIKEGK